MAGRAAEQTGIGADILKKMLPVVATMVMAGLSKQAPAQGAAAGGASQPRTSTPLIGRPVDASTTVTRRPLVSAAPSFALMSVV